MALIFFSPLRKHIDHFLLAWLTLALVAAAAKRAGVTLPLIFDYANVAYAHFFVAGMVFYRLWKGERSSLLFSLLAASAAFPFVHWSVPAAVISASFWVVFWLVVTGSLQFIAVRPLLFLGSISYALYLVHLPIGHTVEHWLNAERVPALAIVLLVLCLVIAVASFITYVIEKPTMAWCRMAYKRYNTRNAAYSPGSPRLPERAQKVEKPLPQC